MTRLLIEGACAQLWASKAGASGASCASGRQLLSGCPLETLRHALAGRDEGPLSARPDPGTRSVVARERCKGKIASYHTTTIFVRFRLQGNRLQASLAQSRRAAGKVQAEHIGALGSVDASVSVRSRLAFWAKLPQRLAALGNRLGSDEHPKIYAALHGRIPMVTAEEQRAVQEENFKDDERFWDTMWDLNAASAEEHKSLIATAEAKLKGHESAAADASEKLETAKNRLQRLQRGESVAGGLGKKFDVAAAMKAAGITPRLMKRARLLSSLTETEFESLLEPTRMKRRIDAEDKAFDREARRIIRAREGGPSPPARCRVYPPLPQSLGRGRGPSGLATKTGKPLLPSVALTQNYQC
jgi:hypothetical protein